MKKAQLFLLHFAGGNHYSFEFLKPYLEDFEIITLELPGRGKRITEKLLTDFQDAKLDVYNQICEKHNGEDFMIYGHSMGACFALSVTNLLEKNNKFPAFVFVSGNSGPVALKDGKRYLLNDDEFVKMLTDLGGIPDELLENQELLEFLLPILRADFKLAEKNELWKEKPISAPIFAMMGDLEKDHKDITTWRSYTKSHFQYEIFGGGHFFIYDHAENIASNIKKSYFGISLLQPSNSKQ